MFQSVIDNLEKILELFNVEVDDYVNRFSGKCPIHNGDNRTAFCVYKETGAWRCFTMGCHEKHGGNALGLVTSLLSKSKCRDVTTNETIEFLEKLLGGKLSIEFDSDINDYFFNKNSVKKTNITREYIRGTLDIPATYFINRGFSSEILDRYDVGLCTKKSSVFNKRCVVPVYDIDYNYMVGCTGRDTTETNPVKWLHSRFQRSNILYNSWFAHEHIKKTNTCLIVESPGNVWRLEEAGIHGSLALFGTQLSFGQMRLLSNLGVLNLVLLFDNDEAGKTATLNTVKKLKGLYNIVVPKYEPKDIAECKIDYLQELILPILKEL